MVPGAYHSGITHEAQKRRGLFINIAKHTFW